MATIGLSRPYFAKYNYDEETRTVYYSDGGLMGRFTELSLDLNDGDDNILYADNAPAESDKNFSGGTVKITTDDLSAVVMLPVLGLKSEAIGLDDVSTEDAKWIVYDDDQAIPYVGIGGIIKKRVRGIIKWVGVIFEKTQFSNPGISAVTQAKTIEWQTSTLSASIMRGDNDKHSWHRITSELNTEAEADAAVRAFLGIKSTSNDEVTT